MFRRFPNNILKAALRLAACMLGGMILLLGAFVAAGWLYQDEVEAYAARQLADYLDADIRIERIEVSFLKSWPEVSVELVGVHAQLTGQGIRQNRFRRPTMLRAGALGFRLDLLSLLTSDYKIRRIVVEEALLYAEQADGGAWNWEVMLAKLLAPDATQPDTGRPFTFELHRFQLNDCHLVVHAPASRLYADYEKVTATISGDFSEAAYNLEADVEGRLLSLASQGIQYARGPRVAFRGELAVDAQNRKYDLGPTELAVEDIVLRVRGHVQQTRNSSGLYCDLGFESGVAEYERVLSLLPGALTTDLRKLDIGGHFKLEGHLTGLAARGSAPDLLVNYRIWDASLENDDPPAAITNLKLHGLLTWNALKPEKARLVVDSLQGRLGPDAFSGRLAYANFVDPGIELALNGNLDLGQLKGLWPEALAAYALRGRVRLQCTANGRLADFGEARNLPTAQASGVLVFQEVSVAGPAFPRPLQAFSATLALNNHKAVLQNARGRLGGGAFSCSGTLENYLPYIFNLDNTLRANLSLKADSLQVEHYLATGEPRGARRAAGQSNTQPVAPLSGLDLHLETELGYLGYDKLRATQVKASVHIKNSTLDIRQIGFSWLQGTWQAQAQLAPSRWSGNLDLQGLDIHQLLSTFPEFGQMLLVGTSAHGKLNTSLSFAGKPKAGFELDSASLELHGTASIQGGQIRDFRLLESMSGFLRLRQFRNIDFRACSTQFSIRNSQVVVPMLHLEANGYTLEANGAHGFDNALDYHLRIRMPRRQWQESNSPEVQAWVQNPAEAAQRDIQLFVHITGTLDNPRFRLDGRAMRQEIRDDLRREGHELEAAAARERDRVFGTQSSETADDWIMEAPRERHDSPAKPNRRQRLVLPFRRRGDRPSPE